MFVLCKAANAAGLSAKKGMCGGFLIAAAMADHCVKHIFLLFTLVVMFMYFIAAHSTYVIAVKCVGFRCICATDITF
jgi:hypothetical protein